MKKLLKNIIFYLIQLIEKYEYSYLDLDENDSNKKIIETISVENLEIETDTGFFPISQIHKTQPYQIWEIETENGFSLRCADNHIIFDLFYNQVFVKNLNINDIILTKDGPSRIKKIFKYKNKISMYDVTVDSNNHRFYSNGILSHNTTTIAAYFAWYLCFHTERNTLIVANKERTTIEIVSKVVHIFRGLPFFLKPGILNIGATGLSLDNGCTLTSQATTSTAAIGFTIHLLYLDEFAHINNKLGREFWRSVYPTLSSSRISQCLITSTPNGMDNLFFEIWDKANRGENSFVFKRVDYWEVPEHDDKWAEQMKKDFGEEEFAQEFELSFERKSNLLLSSNQLKWMKKIEKRFTYKKELNHTDLDESYYSGKLRWHPDFDPNGEFSDINDRFILSNDIAEGKDEDEVKDNDYNVTSIYRVELKSLSKLRKIRKEQRKISNLFRMRQIGVFQDNIGDEEIMAQVNKALVFDQLGEDRCKMVTEMNFNGKAFVKEFSNHDSYYDGLFMRSFHTAPNPDEEHKRRKKIGFKTTRDKDYFCKLGKKLIDEKTIIPMDSQTGTEFRSFGKVKGGWKGIAKHDDLAMTTLNLSRFYTEPEYSDWLYDFLESMPDSPEKKYAMEILEEPYEDTEISDAEFSLYIDDTEKSSVMDIFRQEEKNRQKHNISSKYR